VEQAAVVTVTELLAARVAMEQLTQAVAQVAHEAAVELAVTVALELLFLDTQILQQ
jgi:hypothetical protein